MLEERRPIVDGGARQTTPRVEDLAKLRYIEQILMESLRLWPTAPAFSVKPRSRDNAAGQPDTRSSSQDTAAGAGAHAAPRHGRLGRRRRGIPPGALRARAGREAAPERLEALRQRGARLHRPVVRDAGGADRDRDDAAALRPRAQRSVVSARSGGDADHQAARPADARACPRHRRPRDAQRHPIGDAGPGQGQARGSPAGRRCAAPDRALRQQHRIERDVRAPHRSRRATAGLCRHGGGTGRRRGHAGTGHDGDRRHCVVRR